MESTKQKKVVTTENLILDVKFDYTESSILLLLVMLYFYKNKHLCQLKGLLDYLDQLK